MNKLTILLLPALMLSLAGCNDKNEILPDDTDNEAVIDLPTEDVVTVNVKVPTAVIGSDFDPVTELLIKRVETRDDAVKTTTKAVIIDGSMLSSLTPDQKAGVQALFDRGGCIVVSEGNTRELYDFSMSLGEKPSFRPEDHAGENDHFCDVYVFNNHHDEFYVQDVHGKVTLTELTKDPEDISDNDEGDDGESTGNLEETGKEDVSLSGMNAYTYGMRANDLAAWINENSEPHSAITKSTGIDLGAQRVAYNVYPTVSDDRAKGRSCNYNIVYYITPLYSFSQKLDYYVVHMEISGANSNLYFGSWRSGKQYVTGYYLSQLIAQADLKDDGYDKPNGAMIEKISPETTNNASTLTTGVSFNIGGDVGVNWSGGASAGINTGIDFSESYTTSLPDVAVANQCMSDQSGIQARWVYNLSDPRPTTNWIGDINGFDSPSASSINTVNFHTMWVWTVPHPTGEYRMIPYVRVCHAKMIGKGGSYWSEASAFQFNTEKKTIWLDAPVRRR